MKKILLSVLLFTFAFASIVKAEAVKEEVIPAAKAGGSEWIKWDDGRKKTFLEGFLAGSFYMVEEGYTQTRGFTDEKFTDMAMKMERERDNAVFTGADLAEWSTMEREYFVKERNQSLIKYLVRGVSNEQIIDGLNSLYREAANRGIVIADAVYLVKKQLLKTHPDEVEGIIRYLRSGKKDPGHLKIEDEKGELVRFIQFP